MKTRLVFLFLLPFLFPCPVGGQENTVMLNQISRELNQVRSLLDRAADSGQKDLRRRTERLLDARRLLERIRGRKLQHPDTGAVVRLYGDTEKKLVAELDKNARDNHNQEGLKQCLAYVELLLRILPGDKRYTEWKANLTFKDRARAAVRTYTGDDTALDIAQSGQNESRRLLEEAAERLSFRHLEPALELYREILAIEPRHVEATTRIAELETWIAVDREIGRLEELIEDIEGAAIAGIDGNVQEGAANSLKRLEELDPDLSIRRRLTEPEPPPTLYREGKLDPHIDEKFQERRRELEQRYYLHLCRAGIIHVQNRNFEAGRRYRDEAAAIDRYALEFLVLTLAFDIHEGNSLQALAQLRRMASERELASNMIGFYFKTPYYFFQRWIALQVNRTTVTYWMIFRSHARIYSSLYWPVMLVLLLQLGTLAWSGRHTYAVWDLATGGQLTRIVTFSNRSPVHYYDRAMALMEKGKTEKALRFFPRAIAGDPYMAPAWLGRGQARMALNLFAEARGDLEKALQLRPHEKQLKYLLALTYDRLNLRQEAITTMEDAIGLGLQMRDFKMEDLLCNRHQYRKVFQEYRKTAEKLLEPA